MLTSCEACGPVYLLRFKVKETWEGRGQGDQASELKSPEAGKTHFLGANSAQRRRVRGPGRLHCNGGGRRTGANTPFWSSLPRNSRVYDLEKLVFRSNNLRGPTLEAPNLGAVPWHPQSQKPWNHRLLHHTPSAAAGPASRSPPVTGRPTLGCSQQPQDFHCRKQT